MALDSPMRELIQTYHSVNPSTIDEYFTEPTPVQFLRYVAKNRPFVIRGGCHGWAAVQKWDLKYLREAMGDREVDIAETPYGNADAPQIDHEGHVLFAKPFQRRIPFSDFLDSVSTGNARHGQPMAEPKPIRYSQARKFHISKKILFSPGEKKRNFLENDNLRHEYSPLLPDVAPSIPWADAALMDGAPSLDAINLWLGTDRSVTALHRDGYENVYCQLIGEKHFVLLAPVEAACVNEQWLLPATYDQHMGLVPEEGSERVPCALWDPDIPEEQATIYSKFSRPMRVTLAQGDMMYLPTCW
ncbi:MAG: hypothetical protein Q9163_003562 [Psora crenata]